MNRGNILQSPVIITVGSVFDMIGTRPLGQVAVSGMTMPLHYYDTCGDAERMAEMAAWANRHAFKPGNEAHAKFMEVMAEVEAKIDPNKDPERLMIFDSISASSPDLRFSKKGQRVYDRPIYASRLERVPHMQRSGQRLRKGPK